MSTDETTLTTVDRPVNSKPRLAMEPSSLTSGNGVNAEAAEVVAPPGVHTVVNEHAAVEPHGTGQALLVTGRVTDEGRAHGNIARGVYALASGDDFARARLRSLIEVTALLGAGDRTFDVATLIGTSMRVRIEGDDGFWCGEGTALPAPCEIDAAVRLRLIRTAKETVRPIGANVELILRESSQLRDRIRYDGLANRIEITAGQFAGIAHGLDVAIGNWLATDWEMYAPTTVVAEQMLYVARRWGSYDPLVEHLDGLTWDGVRRIDTWLNTYCDVEPSEYTRLVGAKWMISAVARARKPGEKVDTVLTLVGAQGAKKSTAISILGGPWYVDGSTIDFTDKDSRLIAATGWLIELPELAPVLRSRESSAVKAFMSCATDRLRPPYGRTVEDYARRCVFAATSNLEDVLNDETGNRRWWTVTVGNIDIARLQSDRDQLWAEAVVRYKRGEPWWFETDEERRLAAQAEKDYEVDDPWADLIAASVAVGVKVTIENLAEIVGVVRTVPGFGKVGLDQLRHHAKALGASARRAGLVRDPERVDGRRTWIKRGPP